MKSNFDEMQILRQNRYGRITLYLVIINVLINAVLKSFIGVYAEPLAEAFILLSVPTIYYMIMMIWNHSYFTDNEKATKRLLNLSITMIILLSITILPDIYFKGWNFIFNEEGLLSTVGICAIYVILVYGLLLVTYKIRKYLDKKENVD